MGQPPKVRIESRTARYLQSSLVRKVGVLQLLPLLGAILALLLFGLFLMRTSHAAEQINITGRQRMLAVQLGDWARMVAAGRDEARPLLQDLVADFDRALAALESGGEIEGRTVRPVPDAVRAELSTQRGRWNEVSSRLLTIARLPSGIPDVDRAVADIGPAIEMLRVSADELTGALVARAQALRRGMTLLFGFGVAFNIALVVLTFRFARRHIVAPIKALHAAADRVAEGDVAVRVAHEGPDELGRLAQHFNEMVGRVSEARDVLERHRQLAENLVDSLPHGTALVDDQGLVVHANRVCREMFGLPDQPVHRTPLREICPHPALHERLQACRNDGAVMRGFRADIETPAGTRPLRVTAVPSELLGAQPQLIVVAEDLTEEERLRAHAEASERSFRALIECAPDAITVVRDDRLVYANRAMVRMLGYQSDAEFLGKPVAVFVHPEDGAIVAERVGTMLATGEPAPLQERRLLACDGTIVYAEIAAMPLEFEGAPAILVIARDLTERRHLEMTRMEMDRLIAMGTLAAGVVHEVNNPLSYVMANLEFVAEELPGVADACRACHAGLRPDVGLPQGAAVVPARVDELMELLTEAREGTVRIRDVVRDVKAFSRTGAEGDALLDVRQVLESSINMVYNQIRHRARLEKGYHNVPLVAANESRLAQVFVNLLVNAAQAIPEGAADVNVIRVRTWTEAERVVVEVEDTGRGISEELLARLFDPFFTTKSAGQGTGLGLAICKKIVEFYGGEISVESQVGRGARFRVALPAAGTDQLTEPAPVAAGATTSRRARILVVDDEPTIVRVLQRLLSADHDVVGYTTAREALDLLAAGQRFDIIFCDLMMPEMTGMDLHARILEVAPEQADAMIFLTGGIFTARAQEFIRAVPNKCLDKPFEVSGVRAVVRERLGQPTHNSTA